MPLPKDSWTGLLTWSLTQVRLYYGIHGCLDSLARLTRWLELGIIFINTYGYELVSLFW